SQLGYKYGRKVRDGQKWKFGSLELEAIHTPGHTPGHMSYLLRDYEGNPWMVFTGDALFSGDIGRTDLLGKKEMKKMARLLFRSIFEKLLPLGDEVIVCPAHGAGSVCGGSISERNWTTIGIERKHNPKLASDNEDDFIASAARMLERPPYFRQMEKLNLNPPLLPETAVPPLKPAEFSKSMKGAVVLDTRSEVSFGGAHVPGSLSIWKGGLPAFAGWFLPYKKPILLVGDGEYPGKEIRELARLGYENIRGYLFRGMLSWHMSGRKSSSIGTIPVQNFCKALDSKSRFHILDVRSDDELEREGTIKGAQHIHITQLPGMAGKVPRKKAIRIFCGSGLRSMIAASLLRKEGYDDLGVILGGTSAWNSSSCPLVAP
ncbi:MBL fold metallo-hydrolase, partial [Candidatus Micrarchaeota archaeon]|nr:MBL fold metallo-hydrolase [Candidatus Micrarchaeota archaeon]MBD3417421.1 MBL fold metallo-hydrolase [Candidatus Micrarchaeota archaeon]